MDTDLKKFNAKRSVLRRAYVREQRTIAGIEHTVAHYVINSFAEFRKLANMWYHIGATAFINERIGEEIWECELRFPNYTERVAS